MVNVTITALKEMRGSALGRQDQRHHGRMEEDDGYRSNGNHRHCCFGRRQYAVQGWQYSTNIQRHPQRYISQSAGDAQRNAGHFQPRYISVQQQFRRVSLFSLDPNGDKLRDGRTECCHILPPAAAPWRRCRRHVED